MSYVVGIIGPAVAFTRLRMEVVLTNAAKRMC